MARFTRITVIYERAKAKGWKLRKIQDSGHELVTDQPQELAAFLLEYAVMQSPRRAVLASR